MTRTARGSVTITDIADGGLGSRGAGRWHYRVGTSLSESYTETELNTYLAAVIPGTDQDSPVQGDQLWLFASATIDDITPTAQKVYLYDSTWQEQTEVIDGNLLVTDTLSANKIKTNTLVLGQVTDQGEASGSGISFSNDKIEIRDNTGTVRVTIGNLSP